MKRQKSTVQHTFSEVPKATIQRSSFDRSHGFKTTFDSGYLIPILIDEALPGDTYNVKMSGLARMATPIVPILDNLTMSTFFFAVPYRLVWDNWQKFNGEQQNPGDSIDFVIPTMTSPAGTGYDPLSLEDYMGIPTGVPDLEHSCLWHRAINLIQNEWFRDQNLQNSVIVKTDDGPDTQADYVNTPHRRGKRPDYFTSCLPFPQKGDAVSIPLGTQAPITGIGVATNAVPNSIPTPIFETDGTVTYDDSYQTADDAHFIQATGPGASGRPAIFADLTDATSVTINTLRQGFQVQKLLERDARGGTRYIELLKSHFQVSSPDFRVQRPEYLGGSSTPINITPIAQTQASDPATVTPQANLAAIGTAALNNHGFVKSFTEHCLIIGFVNVKADITYQTGLNRMFSRSTRYDFYWPALSHIGEQAVLQKEIYASGVPAEDDIVFGYQERFAEYRYKPSQITGKFRSNDPQSLDLWHLAQDFPQAPLLDNSFILEVPPVDRVVAVPSEPEFLLDCHFSMRCARPMPLYGVPGMIDHF